MCILQEPLSPIAIPLDIESDKELISIQTSRKKYHKQTINTTLLD